ncbi:helix-turn-helix domain-containing protein [Mesorhizobium sp. B3-1-7]|uniref:helix-turn-helix domain-containing protein n=1 Tax=Mesorhizobium sp. B3-1-7 TaxID=2589894 RepID=UPI00112D718B|nr:helix-turn-helix domain-containing protein [Mesorhizobium sp. B3-1-7]TPI54749.1 helix-turn-helix domain-containing protein [Mesorhizobium sp. B3-1-7]
MSAAKGKSYAAIPARATGDKRLAAEDYRVLMAIALHDRLGANGIGCFASHPRLAELAGCHEKSLSRTLAKLKLCGYLEISHHPMNGRLRVYRIIYTAFDTDYFLSAKGSSPATKKPGAQQVAEALPEALRNGNNRVAEAAPKVTAISENTQENQLVNYANIFSETEINPIKMGNISCEAADVPTGSISEVVPGKSFGAMLGIIERRLQHGMDESEGKRRVAWLSAQLESGEITDDSEYHRTVRVRDAIAGMLRRLSEITDAA